MSVLDWVDMMPFTVRRRTPVSFDDYGKPLYTGDYSYYRARIVYKFTKVTSVITGQDVLANTTVWLGPQTSEPSLLFGEILFGEDGQPITLSTIAANDEITLPDDKVGEILNWEVQSDEVGLHHVKIFINRGV